MPTVKLLSESYHAMPTDGEVNIYYNFTSPNIGFGTVYISIDYNTVETTSIPQGRNFYTVKGLEKGEHRLDIYVTDITGLFSNTITVTIVVGGLELTTTFDDSTDISLEDYNSYEYDRRKGGWKGIHYLFDRNITEGLFDGMKFYGKYECGHEKFDFPGVKEVCDITHEAGGYVVLAHPCNYYKDKTIISSVSTQLNIFYNNFC